LNGFRQYYESEGRTKTIEFKTLSNVIDLIPISNAESERGFSLMNLICSYIRASLLTVNVSNLLFISINGPPLSYFNPSKYVVSWLRKHKSADQTPCNSKKHEEKKENTSLWKIFKNML
jgi:hypothetical protein